MDLDVFGLCLGGNVFGWTADRDASFAVLDAYVEAGGNFIDTADTYMRPNMGISETIIGEWMAARGNRDALVIATKVGSDGGLSAREHRARTPRRRCARLQTDRIDLYYAHKDDGSTCRSRRPCARSTSWCATARCATSPPPTCPAERLRESLELAGARAWPPYVCAAAALQPRRARALRARVRADRGRARARRRAVLRARQRVPDRQVPAGRPNGDSPRARRGRASYLDARGERGAGRAGRGRRRARRRRSRRSPSPGCSAKPGVAAPIASARTRRAARGAAARRSAWS